MARPERKDVDYFPFYVKDGRTLHILESKYGYAGTGFFTNVMRFLCQQPDHHFCIEDEADQMYFFSRCKCLDEEIGLEMLGIMAKTSKLYAPLWVSYKVIVSPDLLESLKDAYLHRKNAIITLDEIIVFYNNNPQESGVSTNINPQESGVSTSNNTQTKLKETKLKETKVYSLKTNFEEHEEENTYLTKKNKVLKGNQLLKFDSFWESFGDPRGRAEAADVWVTLKPDENLFNKIIAGAKKYAQERENILQRNGTPKMAQGWLSGKRWEDEIETDQERISRETQEIKARRIKEGKPV